MSSSIHNVGYESVNRQFYLTEPNYIYHVQLEPDVIEGQEVVISGNFTSTQHENTLKISTVGIDYINAAGKTSLIESITEIPGVNRIWEEIFPFPLKFLS